MMPEKTHEAIIWDRRGYFLISYPFYGAEKVSYVDY
jgi:hypothetical protein